MPILMQAAGEDRLVNIKAVEAFYGRLTTPDRKLMVYDALYHEIYNETEPDREKVINDLTRWLADRLNA